MSRIELPARTMTAGSSMPAVVVIQNNTGTDLHASGCGSLFQVALGNDDIQPSVGWRACLQDFTIPVGESRYPVTVAAFYLVCSSSSVPPCLPDHGPPPLAPGQYRAILFQATDVVPVPPPVDVQVTP